MTDWIRVTAIPNKDAQDSAPRAHFLLNVAAIASISVRPDERVQIAFDMDPYSNRPVIEVVESMAEIEAQLGLRPVSAGVSSNTSYHSDPVWDSIGATHP